MESTISGMEFTTNRLFVENWQAILHDPQKRTILENQLSKILTPKITRYLPNSMQFAAERDSISRWVSDLENEAVVLCAHAKNSSKLVGLVILSREPAAGLVSTVHLGYFFGESDWGKGYATELVTALILAFEKCNPTRLVAGVDRENFASIRVLEKSGFRQIPKQSDSNQRMFEFRVS